MKKQNMNKHYQKQSIKKEYAAARNAGSQTAGTATKSTGKKFGEKASDKIKKFFEKNKKYIRIPISVTLLTMLNGIFGSLPASFPLQSLTLTRRDCCDGNGI